MATAEEEKNLEESIEKAGRELPFKETTEMGEVFANMDSDKADEESGMSNIDFNARLSSWEITSCLVFDELQAMGILPEDARITRQKKRLSVSLLGKGREEKVTIASANRSAELQGKSGGFLNTIGGLFKRRE